MQRKSISGRLKLGLFLGLFLIAFWGTGCAGGKHGRTGDDSSEKVQESVTPIITEGFKVNSVPEWQYFSVDAKWLPDGLGELERGLLENQWLTLRGAENGEAYVLSGDTIYRQVLLMGYDGKDYNTVKVEKRYLQTLQPPYETWQTEEFIDRVMPLFDGQDKEGGTLSQEEYTKLCKIAGYDMRYQWDLDGRLYFGNKNMIWYMEQEEVKTLVNLSEGDLPLTELEGFLPSGEKITIWGSFGEKECLATIEKAEEPAAEKQEILFASTIVSAGMKQAIAEFNFFNPKWRIVTQEAKDGEFEEFRNRIQLEITKGEGPDIVGYAVFVESWEEFAKKGYLEELDELMTGKEGEYWDFCLQSGMADGRRYAIPVGSINLRVAVCSRKTLEKGGRKAQNAWDVQFHTAEELMDFVEATGTSAFQTDSLGLEGGYRFIRWFGGLENAGNPYLDLERGVSHLDGEAFVKLLNFSQKYYGKDAAFHETEYSDNVREGRIAFHESLVLSLSEILYIDELFDGNACFVGYPSVNDKRFRASIADGVMLNRNSDKKEGAKEFFKYLLSEEGQNAYVATGKNQGLFATFSIRKDIVERELEKAKRENVKGKMKVGALSFDMRSLSDEEADDLRKILEQAQYISINEGMMDVIYGIIEEETESFYAGQKSAEEVAANCHNRVQLFLNER